MIFVIITKLLKVLGGNQSLQLMFLSFFLLLLHTRCLGLFFMEKIDCLCQLTHTQ